MNTNSNEKHTWGDVANGTLIEYVFDPEWQRASLAWRTPDGEIAAGDQVLIDGTLYRPAVSDAILDGGLVLFPSKVGPKKSLDEVAGMIQNYLTSNFLLTSETDVRLISWWVMMTWLHPYSANTVYLRLVGDSGSGKTELMRRVAMIAYHPIVVNGSFSNEFLLHNTGRIYRTVFMEGDLLKGKLLLTYYNLGTHASQLITTTRSIVDDDKVMVVQGYQTFYPKMVAMSARDAKKDEVKRWAIQIQLPFQSMKNLIMANVPLVSTAEMCAQAAEIRNTLLRWRLENFWREPDHLNQDVLRIPPTLEDIARSLLLIASGDETYQKKICKTFRTYLRENMDIKSQLKIKVLGALAKIGVCQEVWDTVVKKDSTGRHLIQIGVITELANQIIDNAIGGKAFREALTARKVGHILRDELELEISERRNDGFHLIWNVKKVHDLFIRHGIELEDHEGAGE